MSSGGINLPRKFGSLIISCWTQGLQLGDIDMVVGTHSLISEKIEYSALRIAVIDEQHRFGVIQRGRFNSKVVSCLPSMAIPWFCENVQIIKFVCPINIILLVWSTCKIWIWLIYILLMMDVYMSSFNTHSFSPLTFTLCYFVDSVSHPRHAQVVT